MNTCRCSRPTPRAARKAATEVALCELMQSGVTTLCDLSAAREDWLDALGTSGLRVYAMPMFPSGRWYTPNGHEVRYAWDEKAGRDGLDRALRLIDRARQHPSGRLDGALYPAQVDTCTEELLRDSAAAARERRLPLQTHAAQSVVEFHEIMRRHGKTPIGWLRQIGVLGDNVIIGHAIFLDHHSWLHWPTRNDLIDLADTGTTVAHCPTVFSRRGIMLEDFGRYRAAGVNLGIGTDTFPHNFVEELRTAAILARIAAGNAHAVTAAEILSAALASFAERGFAATRLDDVAARAGITKGTLYLYFRNKEELFKAVVRQELLPAIERAETMVRDPMAPSMVLLEQQAELFARVISSRLSAIPKLVLTEAGNFPDLARFYLEEVVDRGTRLLRSILERGIAAGELRAIDTESAVMCVLAPLLLAALWRHSLERHAGRTLDIDALCRTHLALLRSGLAAEPAAKPSDEGVLQ